MGTTDCSIAEPKVKAAVVDLRAKVERFEKIRARVRVRRGHDPRAGQEAGRASAHGARKRWAVRFHAAQEAGAEAARLAPVVGSVSERATASFLISFSRRQVVSRKVAYKGRLP